MSDYDLCILGAGPSGFAAAMRAWDYGKRVCLIERGRLGGTGIWNGALASKTFWELSRDYRNLLHEDRGFIAHQIELEFGRVANCVERACLERAEQMRYQLEALEHSCETYAGSIDHVEGTASFVSPHEVRVDMPGGERLIRADNFLIATGSRPRILDSIPVDGELIMTSDHVMNLDHFPRSMVILGAGVVGCEFATIFANFAQTKVFMIDRQDRILPFEDEDISRVCARNLESRGVTVHHRARLIDMRVVDGQVEYTIEQHTGGLETLRVERALISVGRVPNTHRLNLEAAGVELTPRGHVVDNDTRTNVPHIYAAGDVTLDIALVNVGEIEGRHAVEHMFAETPPEPISLDNISSIMFLHPEVAAIGYNEQRAQNARIPYRVATYGYQLISRAIAMRATDGFIKILASDDDEMRILGMRALGPHASTALEAVSLMISQGLSVRHLAELLHPHPAVTEGLQECVRMLLGRSIFKPQVFPSALRLSRINYRTPEGGS